jgi:hypothetical protein
LQNASNCHKTPAYAYFAYNGQTTNDDTGTEHGGNKAHPALVAGAMGPADDKAYNLISEAEVIGLGLRTTKAAAKAWTFSYRSHSGVSLRLTIGNAADWPLKLARDEARRLRRLVDQGNDPMAERHELRAAPTVADLVARWREEAAEEAGTLAGRR